MSWYGNPEGHSLAGKGLSIKKIKTVINNIKEDKGIQSGEVDIKEHSNGKEFQIESGTTII